MHFNIQKGLLTELHCQIDFSNWGILLSQPIIGDSRYDFIADLGNRMLRIQCKSCSVSPAKDSFGITCCSHNWNTRSIKSYNGQIDYFYTWYNNQGYLIPIEEVNNTKVKTLRISSANQSRNNSNINWASDYEFEKIILQLNPELEKFDMFPEKNRTEKYCEICGIPISDSNTSGHCLKCSNVLIGRVSKSPSREVLKDMIRTMPFTSIGKEFGVTDNAVRKWCKSYNLPYHKTEIKAISDEDWVNI